MILLRCLEQLLLRCFRRQRWTRGWGGSCSWGLMGLLRSLRNSGTNGKTLSSENRFWPCSRSVATIRTGCLMINTHLSVLKTVSCFGGCVDNWNNCYSLMKPNFIYFQFPKSRNPSKDALLGNGRWHIYFLLYFIYDFFLNFFNKYWNKRIY